MFVFAGFVLFSPLISFLLISLVTRKYKRLSADISIFSMLISLAFSVMLFAMALSTAGNFELRIPWINILANFPIELGVLINPLSVVMLLVVCTVSLLVQIYSTAYMHGDNAYTKYYAFISLFTFSMLGLVLANNFLQMYIFWELVGLCSYLLIGHWYHKPEAANAAKKAFVVTRFGDLGFLVGIILLSFKANTFNILQIEQVVGHGTFTVSIVTVISLLIFAGAVGKSAQFPLHIWLPDAMEGPTPVSALIHAATMVAAGVYLVARAYFLFSYSPTALTVIAVIGCFTAFLAGSIALVQDDVKRVLAYSTVSQLGYMMLGLAVGGYSAGLFHLITHASFKALLFLGAGSIIHAMHTNNIWEMGRLFNKMKFTAITFLIGGLALAGIFPLSGFFSKDAILIQTYQSGHYILFTFALITAAFTSFYMARVFFVIFFSVEKHSAHPHESPPVMYIPLIILSVVAAGLGLFTGAFEHFITGHAAIIHGEEHGAFIPVLSNIIAVCSIAFAWAVYQKGFIPAEGLAKRFAFAHKVLKNKYYIDEFYIFCVRNILFGISSVAAWFDRHVIDGSVDRAFNFTAKFSDTIRKVQTGLLQNYALGIFGGMIFIWLFMNILK